MKKILIVSLMLLALCVSLTACFGSAVSSKTAGEMLAALGFDEKSLLPAEKDHIEKEIVNKEEARSGDFYLYSTASFEEVLKTVFDACKKASDDGVVRDFMTEDPIEFDYQGEDIVWFGYKHDGTFCHVAVSVYPTEEGTAAATEAPTEQETEAATEAPADRETEAATEAPAEEPSAYTVYLLQWD